MEIQPCSLAEKELFCDGLVLIPSVLILNQLMLLYWKLNQLKIMLKWSTSHDYPASLAYLHYASRTVYVACPHWFVAVYLIELLVLWMNLVCICYCFSLAEKKWCLQSHIITEKQHSGCKDIRSCSLKSSSDGPVQPRICQSTEE